MVLKKNVSAFAHWYSPVGTCPSITYIRIYIHHHSLLKVLGGMGGGEKLLLCVCSCISLMQVYLSIYMWEGVIWRPHLFVRTRIAMSLRLLILLNKRMGEREKGRRHSTPRHSTTCRVPPHWGRVVERDSYFCQKCRPRAAG